MLIPVPVNHHLVTSKNQNWIFFAYCHNNSTLMFVNISGKSFSHWKTCIYMYIYIPKPWHFHVSVSYEREKKPVELIIIIFRNKICTSFDLLLLFLINTKDRYLMSGKTKKNWIDYLIGIISHPIVILEFRLTILYYYSY